MVDLRTTQPRLSGRSPVSAVVTRLPAKISVLLVTAVAAVAPTSSPAQSGRCDGQRVAQGAQAVVFTVQVGTGVDLRACLRGGGRTMVLARTDGPTQTWRHPVVAGRFVAYGLIFGDEQCPEQVVEVVDLRRRRAVAQIPAGGAVDFSEVHQCQSTGSPATAVALRSDGLTAFVVDRGDGTYEVAHGAGRNRMVSLGRGADIEPSFVRVTRTEVHWLAGGEVRRARVPRLR